MTQDEIIEMAKQSGLINKDYDPSFLNKFTYAVENFAKLVAQHEREACAKVCDDNADDHSEGDWDSACLNCADHIRARGKA
jgi:hypothetical protein